MRISQKIIYLNFGISCFIQTAIACFALDLLIKTLGADCLGRYFAYSAVLSIGLILISIYTSRIISTINRFIIINTIHAVLAAICLISNLPILQARIVFLAIMGFELLMYFSNWSVASLFITTFESKRIIPRLGTFAGIGVLLGALFAMGAYLGITKTYYFASWLTIKLFMVALGFCLKAQKESLIQHTEIVADKKQEVSILQILKHYKLVPRLSTWKFLWSLLLACIYTLTGITFDKSGVNLTVLYGILSLVTALMASFSASFVYPSIVKWLQLGTMLVAISLTAAFSGWLFLVFNVFVIAIFMDIFFNLLDDCFIDLSISTELGLYTSRMRDRIRLLAEILATSAGASCVGIIFALPKNVGYYIIGLLFLGLVIIGFSSRKGFTLETIQFLKSKDREEQENAIALFDLLENKDGYDIVIDILKNSSQLPLRISVLETFSNLGVLKPAPIAIKLLKESKIDPLRLAILHYLENIQIKKLDPFLLYQLFDTLQDICSSKVSNILRATAIKLWLQHGPLDKSVSFILKALEDKDERIVANAIEGLNYVDYPGIVEILFPFLEHENPRARANCIVTLWKYKEIRKQVQSALTAMITSFHVSFITSGVWAAGEIKDTTQTERIIELLSHKNEQLKRGIPIALLKLGREEYCDRIIDIILGDDEKQAINICYLSLRLDKRILNERIIASIYEKGEAARKLALKHYSQCGGFCREQLELLSGKKEMFTI